MVEGCIRFEKKIDDAVNLTAFTQFNKYVEYDMMKRFTYPKYFPHDSKTVEKIRTTCLEISPNGVLSTL